MNRTGTYNIFKNIFVYYNLQVTAYTFLIILCIYVYYLYLLYSNKL